jgi:hypothetical protein
MEKPNTGLWSKRDELITKIKSIVSNHNVNVMLFQEDVEHWSDKIAKKPLDDIGFTRVGFCKAEGYKVPPKYGEPSYFKQLINSIWVKKDILQGDPEVVSKQIHNECYGFEKNGKPQATERCFIAAKVKISGKELILATAHLCGGKYADQYFTKTLGMERDNEIGEMLKEINEKYKSFPTIFAADFNSIHPTKYDSKKHVPPYLLKDEYKDRVNEYMMSGHELLSKNGLKPAIPKSGNTSNFCTMVDYIYYNPNILDIGAKESHIVKTLDVTDHNGVVAYFNIKDIVKVGGSYNLFGGNPHIKYEDDYLYKKTISALTTSYHILKKYAPNFVKDFGDKADEDTIKKVYDKMYNNIKKSNCKIILDTIFEKKKITKGTVFYSGFTPYPKINLRAFLKDGCTFDREYAINELLLQHNKLSEKFDDKNNSFRDIFKWFTKDRNKGGLYTTSCFDKNDDINNIKMSVSTKYFSKTAGSANALAILETNQDCELYYLHPENFKQRILFKRILTNILLNGTFSYNATKDELSKMYEDWSKPAMLVDYPFTCATLLEKENIDKECVQGYWDGDNTLDEKIVNHFLYVYNEEVAQDDISKKVLGYIARDNGYDTKLGITINLREIVWFNNELTLSPIGLFFKNHKVQSIYDFWTAILYVLEKFTNNIVTGKEIEFDTNKLNTTVNKLCEMGKDYQDGNKNNPVSETFKFKNNNLIEFKNNLIESNKGLVMGAFSSPIFDDPNMAQRGGNKNYRDKYSKYKMKYINAKRMRKN